MGKRIKKKGGFPVWQLFLAGFLLGTILPNVIWKLEWQQKTLASVYLIGMFAGSHVSGKEYFFEVLRVRGGSFLLNMLCGFSIFGVPIAVMTAILTGLEVGGILTMSILQFGLSGGAVGAGLLLPQYLFYFSAMLLFLPEVFRQSKEIWSNHGIFPKSAGKYLRVFLLSSLVYAGGILLEVYCNPWAVEMLIKIFS